MNADEAAIREFLKRYPGIFVSVTEISRRVDARRRFLEDRTWARAILRRMEMEGTLESSPFAEYRLKEKTDEGTSFRLALNKPGMSLGDTTLFRIDDDPE